MIIFALVIPLGWIAYELHQTNHNLRRLNKLMANINERLQSIDTRLGEASTEILALIEKLQGESLSPEGRIALDSLESKANALADIVSETPG